MSKKTITKKKKQNRPTDISLAVKISDQVELEEVKLLTSEFRQLPPITQGEKFFDVDRTVRVEVDKDKNRIVVFPKFELKGYSGKKKAEQDEPFLNIKAMFALVYRAKDLSKLSKKAFDSFGQANGIYNAWPYWREFVQNVTTRMGLPSLTVPVFRIVAPPQKEASTKKGATKKKIEKK